MYEVLVSKRVLKNVERMPESVQDRMAELIQDLKESGPLQPTWPNYVRLRSGRYHCHLSYKWVACWYHHKGSIRIEVYYAGSREDAPY
jgi:mRNA-degrading endonuclease RelE of RelBE toxin-antitoxin system